MYITDMLAYDEERDGISYRKIYLFVAACVIACLLPGVISMVRILGDKRPDLYLAKFADMPLSAIEQQISDLTAVTAREKLTVDEYAVALRQKHWIGGEIEAYRIRHPQQSRRIDAVENKLSRPHGFLAMHVNALRGFDVQDACARHDVMGAQVVISGDGAFNVLAFGYILGLPFGIIGICVNVRRHKMSIVRELVDWRIWCAFIGYPFGLMVFPEHQRKQSANVMRRLATATVWAVSLAPAAGQTVKKVDGSGGRKKTTISVSVGGQSELVSMTSGSLFLDKPVSEAKIRADFANGAYVGLVHYAGTDDADLSSNNGDWLMYQAGYAKTHAKSGIRFDVDGMYMNAAPLGQSPTGDYLDVSVAATKKAATIGRTTISPFIRIKEMWAFKKTGTVGASLIFEGVTVDTVLSRRAKLSQTADIRYDDGGFGKGKAFVASWRSTLILKLSPHLSLRPSYSLIGPLGSPGGGRTRHGIFGCSLAWSY